MLKLISCGHSLWEFDWYPPILIIIVLKPLAVLLTSLFLNDYEPIHYT